MIPFIFWVLGALAPSTPLNESMANLELYYETVARIESNRERYATNDKTSAASYFQVTSGAFRTAKIRAKRYGYVVDKKFVSELTYEEQMQLLFLDLYAREGTNRHISGILRGDRRLAMAAYYKWHHTKPDPATIKRAERIFKENYN